MVKKDPRVPGPESIDLDFDKMCDHVALFVDHEKAAATYDGRTPQKIADNLTEERNRRGMLLGVIRHHEDRTHRLGRATAARPLTEADIHAELADLIGNLEPADKLDRKTGTDRGGWLRDVCSVLRAELKRRTRDLAAKRRLALQQLGERVLVVLSAEDERDSLDRLGSIIQAAVALELGKLPPDPTGDCAGDPLLLLPRRVSC